MPKAPHRLLFIILAAAAAAPVVVSQSSPAPHPGAAPGAAGRGAFRQLLYLPAPTPRTAPPAEEEARQKLRHRPGGWEKEPADDAPEAEVVDYWKWRAGGSGGDGRKPSDAVRQRLLTAAEADPEILPRLLPVLPDTREAADRVKKLYDAAQGDERFDAGWRKSVRGWLRFNSAYFLGDLLSEARRAKDGGGYVDKEEALRALARVEWESAAPLLESLAAGGQPRTAAAALALLHRHALAAQDSAGAERFRDRLRAVAADRAAPARARVTAVEELSEAEWAGRDEWYLSLFADETLLEPEDGQYLFGPLTTLFDRDPDKWIPVMAKLVESKDAAVRQNAANCLVQYATARPRRDAILPVLRWLSDPDWLAVNETQYTHFIHRMDELDVPESVPGLLWIVEHDEWNRAWAARALARYKDPRAVPVLRKAFAEEQSEDRRQHILRGLIASGGLTEAEQVAGLEAYAAKLAEAGGREEIGRHLPHGAGPLPPPVSVGNYLAGLKEPPDALAREVLARAEALRERHPAWARALLGVAEGWQTRQVELDILRRIAEGSADAATIANALGRRAKLRESLLPELQLLAGNDGAPRGLAAVVLSDELLAQDILASNDSHAQLALLACARLTQTPLPVALVGPLLRGADEDLALAAVRYLLAEDGEEARRLLWARYPGEAFVTGWRENIPLIGGRGFSNMGRAEEKLRAELFREGDAPLEVFALLGNGERPLRALRVYAGKAVYTGREDDSRYRERAVTAEELARFKQFVEASGLPGLGPQLQPCHHDCASSEFLYLRREGGRRVFRHGGFGGWLTLLANFELLGRGDAAVRYHLEEKMKGLEILLADDSISVKDVWQRGTDLRLLVERGETPGGAARPGGAAGGGEEDVEEMSEEEQIAARVERRRRELERARARFSWRTFAGGRLGPVTARPEGYSSFDEAPPDADFERFPVHLNSRPAQAAVGKYHVLAADLGEGGLWKKAAGQTPVRVGGAEGLYADPLVTPDGAWVVAARAETDWGQPNDVVRINLATGREYRVNLPPADQFAPVTYVAAHGKVLLRRARNDGGARTTAGPDAPEFYLLDAATGRTQPVAGDFGPLLLEGGRPLQPTGRPGEFWAALPDRRKNETRVGRYSLRDFSFRPTLVVPHLTFDSTSAWADEGGGKLYVAYEGHLLRLPLPVTTPPGGAKDR